MQHTKTLLVFAALAIAGSHCRYFTPDHSKTMCGLPGYCAEGAEIIAFHDRREVASVEACASECMDTYGCDYAYFMDGRTQGCFLLAGKCTKFVPVDDVVDARDGRTTRFRFFQRGCFF